MTESEPSFYLPQIREEISQGDVFFRVPVVDVTYPTTDTKIKYINAIMLTHDCEFDKEVSRTVIFAEVRPLSEVPAGSQGNVRNNTPLNTFYLPPSGDLEESYVDMRRMYRVDKSFITEGDFAIRTKSVHEDVRLALQRVISTYFGLDRDTVPQERVSESTFSEQPPTA